MASATRLIPAPPNSDEKPFEIGDSITVFDAAMIYAGCHPHKVFLKDGSIDEHLKFLGAGIREQPRSRHRVRTRRSRDIYCGLIARIKNGTITPLRDAPQADSCTAAILSLFDYHVGVAKQRKRYGKAEGLGRFAIDDQLDLSIFFWTIGCALERHCDAVMVLIYVKPKMGKDGKWSPSSGALARIFAYDAEHDSAFVNVPIK